MSRAFRSCSGGCAATNGRNGINGMMNAIVWHRRVFARKFRCFDHHASVFVWSNASDGIPPEANYAEITIRYYTELHWQNAVVNTVSAFAKDSSGNRVWDGIRMEGPYCWRPPSYWFSGKYPATCGSTVEQGDNEQIPTLESLRKFIPEDKLWPINDTWYMHAGAWAN